MSILSRVILLSFYISKEISKYFFLRKQKEPKASKNIEQDLNAESFIIVIKS